MEEGTKKFILGLIIGGLITGVVTYIATTAANVTTRAIEINWLKPESKVCVYPCNMECGSDNMEYLPTMGKNHIFPDMCVRNPTNNKVKINHYYVESSVNIPRFPKGDIKSFEVEPNGGEIELKEVYRFETPKESTPFFMRFCIRTVDGGVICSEQLEFIPQGEILK